ncbi:hypothetical protein L249_7090 [Ophiocordyceps polyrhachis-furcata BCC 54312]|uniref:Uncharacterized protein n=1 Tax=Ophiocordyceps polyrhachis-furcata BCC 54312 TaxID=1330021 RepID=A0A367LLA2_9HYPO|nr:hypothetical protein L249_7090 [Ophiocordyceps polyrhachis-furcata BCC 54312]
MKLKLIMNWNTMTWLYVTTFRLFVGRYDRYWYSASIAYSAPIDVQRADRCDDRCNESIGRYDRYSPTVTQGVWPYRLISYPFKMKKYALYSS